MAKQTKQEKPTITKAEKKDAVKALFRELLQNKSYKRTQLIDETAALYTQRFPDKDTENVNDVKGRVGSVFDIMKKDGEIVLDGGMYALKGKIEEKPPVQEPENNPPKKTVKKKTEEKDGKRSMKRAAAKKGDKKEKDEPIAPILPITPINPNYPIDPIAPVVFPMPIEEPEQEKEDKEKATAKKKAKKEKTQEKTVVKTRENAVEAVEESIVSAPKKRSRKPKAKTVNLESQPVEENSTPTEIKKIAREETSIQVEEKTEEREIPVVEEASAQETKKEEKTAAPVFDMSLLLGAKKVGKTQQAPVKEKTQGEQEKTQKQSTMSESKEESVVKSAAETHEILSQKTQTEKPISVEKQTARNGVKKQPITDKKPVYKSVKPSKSQTAEEQLKERFLKRLRSLSGEYFEYYSTYLLERYSMKNGRRLESLRVCGGERDGGIDGEIELTDRLGFRETIYIQAKNWNPEKGDEKVWVVGETLLQQFIGACVCRQAKDGKQHCRGIFITTSRFTTEAKRLLEQMSDKIVGYDGGDLYEAAKECQFGIVQKNGEWALDDKLLSGEKAFFSLY